MTELECIWVNVYKNVDKCSKMVETLRKASKNHPQVFEKIQADVKDRIAKETSDAAMLSVVVVERMLREGIIKDE